MNFIQFFTMKKLSIIWLCVSLLLCFQLQAQTTRKKGKNAKATGKFITQLGIGWNYSMLEPTGFNHAMKQFDGNVEEITWMHAPSLAVSVYGNPGESHLRLLFDFGLTGRWRNIKIDDNASSSSLKTTFHFHTARLGIGTLPFQSHTFDVGLGVGFDGGIAMAGFGKDVAEIVQTEFVYGASVFMPIYVRVGRGFSIGLRPYYQYQLKELNFAKFNQKLNPDTYLLTPPEKLKSKPHHFGIELHFNFFNGVYDVVNR
jgi:hypothetical protein